ncbi:hypothetical protein EDC04DRAFT_684189 [Pisolithus marmoratus]|nr:hypothetical protein EDC04DRAFT_684189 [Pisolithus marmoratus]
MSIVRVVEGNSLAGNSPTTGGDPGGSTIARGGAITADRPSIRISVGDILSCRFGKLNNKNWRVWKIRMTSVLLAYDLYDIVTGADKRPPDDQVDEVRYWKRCDLALQALILLNIADDRLFLISRAETSAEMWKLLHMMYG